MQYPESVYTSEFPKAKVHVIEGAGHYVYSDKGQTTVKLIAQCLAEIESKL